MNLSQKEKSIVDDVLKITAINEKITIQEQTLEHLQNRLIQFDRVNKKGINLQDELKQWEEREKDVEPNSLEHRKIRNEKGLIKSMLSYGTQEHVARRIIQELISLKKYKKIKLELEAKVEAALQDMS